MPRTSFPQFIIVSGSGKKVGKTHMVTALIRSFSGQLPLLALKISPHVHDSLGNSRLLFDSGNFRIYQDNEPHHKNSGQYLQSGARASYFMETQDDCLHEAFAAFMQICNPDKKPVICESGALGNMIKPALLIFIISAGVLPESKKKSEQLADLVLPARIFSAEEITRRINWTGVNWLLD